MMSTQKAAVIVDYSLTMYKSIRCFKHKMYTANFVYSHDLNHAVHGENNQTLRRFDNKAGCIGK